MRNLRGCGHGCTRFFFEHMPLKVNPNNCYEYEEGM